MQTLIRVTILTSDNIIFRTKKIIRDSEGKYGMIKRLTYQSDITILKVFGLNYVALKHITKINRAVD